MLRKLSLMLNVLTTIKMKKKKDEEEKRCASGLENHCGWALHPDLGEESGAWATGGTALTV